MFMMPVESYDVAKLPADCRDLTTAEFRHAAADAIRKDFQPYGGKLEILIDQKNINVTWTPATESPTPLQLALQLLKARKFQEAIQVMRAMLEIEPGQPEVMLNLGMAYSDLGQLEQALAVLLRYTEMKPDNVDGWVALGVGFYRSGMKERAAQAFQQALKLDPKNAYAHRDFGVFLADAGQFQEAEEHFRTALKLAPGEVETLFGLAMCLRMQNQTKAAEDLFRQIIDIDPDSDIAELSRTASRGMAEDEFKRRGITGLRMDAVFYCLSALQHLKRLTPKQVQQFGLEIAMLGQQGLDVNDPAKTYTIKSMPAFRQNGSSRVIQTDAAINHGNSGGPLFLKKKDRYHWLGVNTSRYDDSTGLGFAIYTGDVFSSKYAWYEANKNGAAGALRELYHINASGK